MRKELQMCFFVVALQIVLNRFTATPDWLLGMMTGAAIALGLLGVLPAASYARLKRLKKLVVKRLT